MSTLGVDLRAYIDKATWMTEDGFDFICKDCGGLSMALIQNEKFGCDSALGGSLHKGVSYREDNQPDSLHLILYPGTPGAAGDNASIHHDKVSPVAGRDPRTKKLNYDYGRVLQHLVTDAKKWPLIVPSSEAGLVFGVRF